MQKLEHILEAKEYVTSKANIIPTIGIILGSGLGSLADEVTNAVRIPYGKIPHFVESKAEGHANELVIGELSGKNVVVMKGRIHYYEGYSLDEITFPVRLMKALGVETVIITNSGGGTHTGYRAGDLMLLTDHINLLGHNPLVGMNDDRLGTRFPDATEIYSKELRGIFKAVAKANGISVQEGVYACWSGPNYETPAEVRMSRILGADAVGMSTVPEALVALHSSMKIVGISTIVCYACGVTDEPLNHEEVMQAGAKATKGLTKLIKESITSL